MAQRAQQPDAAEKSIVWIAFFGGPCDGEVTAVARSLVGGPPLWMRRKTKRAIHIYRAYRQWTGEQTIAVYHRGAYRIHFPGK